MLRLSEREAELLVALSELRYLSTNQIQQTWYPDAPISSVERRLRALRGGGVLESSKASDGRQSWRLGGEGIREARSLRGVTVRPYKDVTTTFLPHLLDTNELFVHLAGGEWLWERLRFLWLGSHRAALGYRHAARGRHSGALRQRDRVLRPDAIVTPKASGPRLFIELDRSTECIREKDGRRSITGKLRAYRAFLRLPELGRELTPYRRHFADGRPPKVVFVLSKKDERAADPKDRHRRRRSILAAAREVDGTLDVVCVGLQDVKPLRAWLGLDVPPRPQKPNPPCDADLSDTGIEKLTSFYKEAVAAMAGITEPEARQRAATQARSARDVLERLYAKRQRIPRNAENEVSS